MQAARFTRVLLSFGALMLSSAALASVDTLTEYSSWSDWNAAVSNVSSYQISQVPGGSISGSQEEVLANPVIFGPGTFTANWGVAVIYNDQYGSPYFSDDPGAFGGYGTVASVTVAFSAADDISALAFDLGADGGPSVIDISVNGCSVAPSAVSSLFPTVFFGVTDTTDPITSITFRSVTSPNYEMDVIGAYETATAAAPEMSPAQAPAALTLLLGMVAMLQSRRRSLRRTV